MSELYSKVIGFGKPLLILHGFLGMSDNWKTLGGKYAEEGFEVHLIDQRNHGRSFHAEEFNYDVLTEDLSRYIQQKELDKVTLLGHSMGGKTVMQFAVTYPENVEKLIVADIAPKYYPPHHGTIVNGLLALDFDEIKNRKEADEALSKYIFDWGTRQFLLKNLFWKTKERLDFRFNLSVLKDRQEEIGEGLPSFTSYDGPTLFLRGDKSEYVMPEDETLIKTHFPNSEIVTIANSGHWLHAENPTDFFQESIHFMKK
ncbi:Pimeloyl-ACP methyl ester carboxylesterase [Pustulibacterium marinum]|uniref:Pimeloyl-ACP methyl ester carboxylesterase n=1 Tax=Pustulibacterium marinum TaxID=1224947 RepID=A0A1I7GRI7_9FLAO|nr:alpha/beta fold hydrolase [Pustulibacterium marinum]SFU50876.1 Pimeloyl-ACP methyl ester carboxylesterase [Pustulibacterium marinum]